MSFHLPVQAARKASVMGRIMQRREVHDGVACKVCTTVCQMRIGDCVLLLLGK